MTSPLTQNKYETGKAGQDLPTMLDLQGWAWLLVNAKASSLVEQYQAGTEPLLSLQGPKHSQSE